MKKLLFVLFIVIVLGITLGCKNPTSKPEPTHNLPHLFHQSTPIPESEWYCLKGKVEVIRIDGPYGDSTVSIIGDQLICARDWKLSGVFGPTGYLDDHPETVITFGDLKKR